MKFTDKIKAGLAAVVVAGTVVATALANNWATFSLSVPPAIAVVTATPLTNNTGTAFLIPAGQPLSLVAQVWGNISNVQPVVIGFDVSPDGVNWSTTQPFKFTNNLPGVTNGGLPIQFTADMLRGYQYLKYTYISAISATAITNYGINGAYFY